MCTGEKGIEPLSVVLETTVLPIKLFSRCVVCVVYVLYVCLHQMGVYNAIYTYIMHKHMHSVYTFTHIYCVYNLPPICIVCTISMSKAKLYYLLQCIVCRTAVLPYCHIAILPYCHIAVLPYCVHTITRYSTMHNDDLHMLLSQGAYAAMQVYGKHSKDRSTPETKTTQASENGKKVFHPNFISWSYR